MAIQDDFTINPDTKVIRHDSSKTAVYSAVAFYSFLQDTFDEPGFLSYEIPIRFNTPTSFTMLNGWFLDDGDGSNILQFLTGGGIDTLGYATITDSVLMIDLDYSTRSFIASDLDKIITHDGTVIGPLLSYKDDYPSASTARIWVRDTTVAGTETTIPGEIIDVTAGDGNYTSTGYSAIGDNIYHNLFTIAAFPAALNVGSGGNANPQVYVYQNHPVSGTRTRISEWSHLSNWGDGLDSAGTSTLQNRGSIDVLITIQLGGVLIDGGSISTFVRQTGDTFTFVESTLTTSGRTPIATETSSDTVNIVEGEHYLLVDGVSGGVIVSTLDVGDIVSNVPTGNPNIDLIAAAWYAEIVAVTEFATATTGMLELRGLRGTISDGDNIYVGNSASIGQANGTPGDTLAIYASGTAPLVSDIGKIALGNTIGTPRRIIRGFDTSQFYVILQADPTAAVATRNSYYADFGGGDNMEATTDGGTMNVTLSAAPGGSGTTASNTLISGFNDITVAHINGTITTGAFSGAFTAGERVTWSGGEGIFVTGAASPMTLGNVQNPSTLLNTVVITGDSSTQTATASATLTHANQAEFNFTLQNFTGGLDALYSVFIEGGSIYQAGRSLTDVYAYLQYYLRDGQSITDRVIYTSDGSVITQLAAEEYIKADSTYASLKPAPFGTLAGGVFFGAQAVWIQGMSSADNNNVALTDAGGTARNPFTAIDIVVTNVLTGDRIAIYRDTATQDSLPDKNQFPSHASANVLGASQIDHAAATPLAANPFPNDTPTGAAGSLGTVIMVDNTFNKQHRYRYISFNAVGGDGDDGRLILATQIGPTAATAATGQTLVDTVGTPFASGVQIGDIIHRTDGTLGFCYVTAVTDSNTLQTTLFEDTSSTAAARTWSATDIYEINSLVKSYNASDTFFIPYMDQIATSDGSITASVTYVADRTIILEARNVASVVEIVPFKTTGTITITGYSQGVIRNEDTVFTV